MFLFFAVHVSSHLPCLAFAFFVGFVGVSNWYSSSRLKQIVDVKAKSRKVRNHTKLSAAKNGRNVKPTKMLYMKLEFAQ